MSRVYEALRQSAADAGAAASFLDPDSFIPPVSALPPQSLATTLSLQEIMTVKPSPQPQSRLVSLTDDNSLGAEKFRFLKARVRNLRDTQQIRRLVITSAVAGEGKTLISMNLAIALARHTTDKVLLLEGDLRKPTLAQHFGIPNAAGLDDWFSSNDSITKFLYHFDDLQLWFMPAGVPHDNPGMILQSARFLHLYEQLDAAFDWILIDAPPLLPMADVNFWSHRADGLVVVSREGRTPKLLLKKGLEALDKPKLLGIVINDAHAVENSYYRHYYYRTFKDSPGK